VLDDFVLDDAESDIFAELLLNEALLNEALLGEGMLSDDQRTTLALSALEPSCTLPDADSSSSNKTRKEPEMATRIVKSVTAFPTDARACCYYQFGLAAPPMRSFAFSDDSRLQRIITPPLRPGAHCESMQQLVLTDYLRSQKSSGGPPGGCAAAAAAAPRALADRCCC